MELGLYFTAIFIYSNVWCRPTDIIVAGCQPVAPCAPMRLNSRPCVQCAHMRLSVLPYLVMIMYQCLLQLHCFLGCCTQWVVLYDYLLCVEAERLDSLWRPVRYRIYQSAVLQELIICEVLFGWVLTYCDDLCEYSDLPVLQFYKSWSSVKCYLAECWLTDDLCEYSDLPVLQFHKSWSSVKWYSVHIDVEETTTTTTG